MQEFQQHLEQFHGRTRALGRGRGLFVRRCIGFRCGQRGGHFLEQAAGRRGALEALGHGAQSGQLFRRRGSDTGDLVDRIILHHALARHVPGLRLGLAPGGSGAQRHLQVHASAPGAGAKGGQLALRGVTGGRAKRGSSKGSGRAKRGGGSAAGRADRDGRRFSVPHQGATCSDGSASDDSAAPSRPDRTTARTVIGVPSADVRENRTRAPARGWDEDDLGSRRAARSTAIADDLL